MAVATLEPTISAANALAEIEAALDLSQIRRKLAAHSAAYSPRQLDTMEGEYQKFLALHRANPDAKIVPCETVDTIWHQHILDTIAYRRDCERIFGRFIDHYPYFGTRGPDDAKSLIDCYDETLRLYRDAFGEPPTDTWTACDNMPRMTDCHPVP
jgi:hypothetical protein